MVIAIQLKNWFIHVQMIVSCNINILMLHKIYEIRMANFVFTQVTSLVVYNLGVLKRFVPCLLLDLAVLKHFGLKNQTKKIDTIPKNFL